MANNYEMGTVSPYFPPQLIADHSEELSHLGAEWESDGYIYIEDGCEDWDELGLLLQKMLWEWHEKYPNPPKYCYIKACFYCDKMRQDEFGGFVIFITEKGIVHDSTDAFVLECVNKVEKEEMV